MQVFQYEQDSVRANEQQFTWWPFPFCRFHRIVVEDQIEGIETRRRHSVRGENSRRQRALKRSEAKNTVPVALEDQSHHPVAESAHAIVEKDGMAHRFEDCHAGANVSVSIPAQQTGFSSADVTADLPKRTDFESLCSGIFGLTRLFDPRFLSASPFRVTRPPTQRR